MICNKINLLDKDLYLYYGSTVQKDVGKLSNKMNDFKSNADNTNVVKAFEELTSLINQSQLFNNKKLFFNLFKKNESDLKKEKDDIIKTIEKAEHELEKYKRVVLKGVLVLDVIKEDANKTLKKLIIYTEAGKIKLTQSENNFTGTDLISAQNKHELELTKDSFTKKLNDLNTNKIMTEQLIALIDIVSYNNKKIYDKAEQTLKTITPILKKQVSVLHSIKENQTVEQLKNTKEQLINTMDEILKLSKNNGS